jgi:hypothetical protein
MSMGLRQTAILFSVLALAAAPATDVAAQAARPAPKAARPGSPRPLPNHTAPPGPFLFHGYACGNDCTGHQEGYAWASAHKISNPMDCRGTSETFIEGCRAFAGIEGPLGVREIFQDED